MHRHEGNCRSKFEAQAGFFIGHSAGMKLAVVLQSITDPCAMDRGNGTGRRPRIFAWGLGV
jgi:hypothetical protein